MDKRVYNQVRPPKPKHREADSLGNIRKKIYLKNGGTTMILARDVAVPVARLFVSTLRGNAKKLGINLESNPIIAQ